MKLEMDRWEMRQKLMLAVLPILGFAILHHCSPDGLQGIACRILVGDDAIFGSRYTERGFRQIRNDRSLDQVITALGDPIEIWMRDEEFHRWTNLAEVTWTTNDYALQYSVSPKDSSYTRRVVEIQEGKVTGKIAEFYLD